MELTNTIDIDRPVADVFRFVATDHEKNHPRWDPNISDMRQTTDGPVAIGATFIFTRKIMGKSTPMQFKVTELQQGEHLTFEITGPISMMMHITLEPIGDAQTRLTFHGTGELDPMMQMMEPMIHSQMGKEIVAAQGRIKAILESEHA